MDRPLHCLPALQTTCQTSSTWHLAWQDRFHDVYMMYTSTPWMWQRFWRQTAHCPIPMEDVHKLVKVVGSRQVRGLFSRHMPWYFCTYCYLMMIHGSLMEHKGLTRECGKPTVLGVKVPDCPLDDPCQGPGH